MLTLALQQRDSEAQKAKGGEALRSILLRPRMYFVGEEFQQKKSPCFSECGTKIYKRACHPTAKGRGPESRGMLVRPTAAGKRDDGTDRDGPCLVSVLPSPLARPPPGEGLTPKLRVYRNKTTRPQQGSAGKGAAEHPRDAPRALEPQTRIWVTCLGSFMASVKGSVSPSSSTITGAHILQV